jgi:POT family proton-dependent oligopeptide transporter
MGGPSRRQQVEQRAMTAIAEPGPSPKAQYPRQVPYIIGNEACERFSFYGMRNILTQFLASSVILAALGSELERKAGAKEVFHVFVIGVYFFPLLGGWLSDRYLGKYRTILYLSLVYCLGHLLLALFPEDKTGFYAGLFFIALGSGGIKPCVSAFVGEQFDTTNKHLAKVVFDAFYWIINFGSFFASLFIPVTLEKWGPDVAFGIPGVLMFIATLIFWMGSKLYVVEPPQPADPNSFYRVVATAIRGGGTGLALYWVGVALAIGALGVGVVDVSASSSRTRSRSSASYRRCASRSCSSSRSRRSRRRARSSSPVANTRTPTSTARARC